MITINNADAALKNYYLDAVSAQLNGGVSPFFNAIEKTTANVFGKDVKVTVVKGGMGSVVAADEDGALPAPYANRYFGITAPLKNIYGTIEISDKAIRASRDSSGAFVNLLNAETEGLIASAKANFSRMLFGDGNGAVAVITGKVTGDDYSLAVNCAKDYLVGLTVDICNGSTKVKEGIKITSVAAKKITFDTDLSAVTVAKGYTVNISGAYGKELIGLGAIFGTGKLYGYERTEAYFKPLEKSVTTLTESDVVDMIDELEARFDAKPDMIICSHSARKKIASFTFDARRQINTTDLMAGYSSVVVNDVPVYADKYCPDDKIYLLNTADFSLNQLCDWEWLEDEDGRILRQISGKAAYSATLVKYAELICKRPCGQGCITIG